MKLALAKWRIGTDTIRTMRRRPAPASQPVSRLPFLEGLRGVAALYVVLGHICFLADPARLLGHVDRAPQWLQILMRPFQFGHLAVAAFIVLSGFCLQLSLFSRDHGQVGSLKRFYTRRAKRILPAYYACLAFSILVCLNVTAHQPDLARFLPVTTPNVLAHVFLVHNFSEAWMYKINGVLWSIAIEAQLYVIFPLLVLSISRFGRRWTLAGAIGVALFAMAVVPRAPKLYPWFFPLFVLGMVAAHHAFRPGLRRGISPGTAWLGLIGGLGTALYFINHKDPLAPGDAGMGLAVASLCYLLTTCEQGRIMSVLSWRPLVHLGAFSYSLYLMHHPILQIVYAKRPVHGEGPILLYLILIGLPVVLVGTYLFSLVFEKPFMPRRNVTKFESKPGLVPLSLPLRTYDPPEPKASAKPSWRRSESFLRAEG